MQEIIRKPDYYNFQDALPRLYFVRKKNEKKICFHSFFVNESQHPVKVVSDLAAFAVNAASGFAM